MESTCRARIPLTVLTVLRSTVVPRLRMVRRAFIFFFLYPPSWNILVVGTNENYISENYRGIKISFFFIYLCLFVKEYLRKAAPYVEGGYNDIDPGLNPALQDHYRITPSPGGPGDQYGTFGNFETG